MTINCESQILPIVLEKDENNTDRSSFLVTVTEAENLTHKWKTVKERKKKRIDGTINVVRDAKFI